MRGITEGRLIELMHKQVTNEDVNRVYKIIHDECQELNKFAPVVGYEKHYLISTDGVIKKISGEIIGTWKNDQGYVLARLSNPRAVVRVHRLVAEAFIHNPDNLPIINHIDHCRSNNSVSNLEWCTQKHNLNHARENGRMLSYWQGKRSPNAKLNDDEIKNIVYDYETGFFTYKSLADKYKTSKRTIGRILNGESYA